MDGKMWWLIVPALFFIAGLGFMFGLTGHGYFALLLMAIGALIIFYKLAGATAQIIVTLFLALGLVVFVTLEIPIIANARTDAEEDCEYVIVLGAGLRGTVPSLSLTNRMQGALDWLKTHEQCIAIVSGGQGEGEDITEASAMKKWLVERGISEERIFEEGESTSTMENLGYSLDIIRKLGGSEKSKIAIVTSEYHLYRAKLLAKELGIEARGVAAHTTMPTLMINYFIREAFGVLGYKVFGA